MIRIAPRGLDRGGHAPGRGARRPRRAPRDQRRARAPARARRGARREGPPRGARARTARRRGEQAAAERARDAPRGGPRRADRRRSPTAPSTSTASRSSSPRSPARTRAACATSPRRSATASRTGPAVVVVGNAEGGKADARRRVHGGAVERGVTAPALLAHAAKVIGGGAGGKDILANAGGKDAARLPEALGGGPRHAPRAPRADDPRRHAPARRAARARRSTPATSGSGWRSATRTGVVAVPFGTIQVGRPPGELRRSPRSSPSTRSRSWWSGEPRSMDGGRGPSAEHAARVRRRAPRRPAGAGRAPGRAPDDRRGGADASARRGSAGRRRRAVIDATAAQVILQAWLDAHTAEPTARDPRDGPAGILGLDGRPDPGRARAGSRRRPPRAGGAAPWPRVAHRRARGVPGRRGPACCGPRRRYQDCKRSARGDRRDGDAGGPRGRHRRPTWSPLHGRPGSDPLRRVRRATSCCAGPARRPRSAPATYELDGRHDPRGDPGVLTTPPPKVPVYRGAVPRGAPDPAHLRRASGRSRRSPPTRMGLSRRRFARARGERPVRRSPPYLPEGTATAEGFLFPATYEFVKKDISERAVIEAMLGRVRGAGGGPAVGQRRGPRSHAVRGRDRRLDDRAGGRLAADERPLIAGVIYNRLRDGMPLGIDATLLYEDPSPDGELTTPDIETDNPYNTQDQRGAAADADREPGRATRSRPRSRPERHALLSTTCSAPRTGDGVHRFAETLAEHEAQRGGVPRDDAGRRRGHADLRRHRLAGRPLALPGDPQRRDRRARTRRGLRGAAGRARRASPDALRGAPRRSGSPGANVTMPHKTEAAAARGRPARRTPSGCGR